MKNQKLIINVVFAMMLFSGMVTQAFSQNIDQIRWKSEDQVREVLGEPLTVTSPVGTHATYTLWKYERYTIAFADGKAFHLFDKDSLTKFELQENRPNKN
jgi:hypothetical protein